MSDSAVISSIVSFYIVIVYLLDFIIVSILILYLVQLSNKAGIVFLLIMSSSQKRVRKKSRKLSEAEQEEIEPPKKRVRHTRLTTPTLEEKPSRKLVVSLQNSAIGTRVISRLQRRTIASSVKESKKSPSTVPQDDEPPVVKKENIAKFKNPNFSFSFIDTNKKRTWKGLKQIIQSEKSAKFDPDIPTYNSIDAPPSLKPSKRYSDISGLVAQYTDPLTLLHFSTSNEFETIRTLPSNIVQGYLGLRGKATIT